jgi:hypothetical protein
MSSPNHRRIGTRLIDQLGLGDPLVAANRVSGRTQEWHKKQRAKAAGSAREVPEKAAETVTTVMLTGQQFVSDDQSATLRQALEGIAPDAVKAVRQAVRGVGKYRHAPASVRYQAAKDVLQAQGLLRPDATLAERATADMSPEELRRFIARGQAALDQAQQSGSTVIDGTFTLLASADDLHEPAPDATSTVAQQPECESGIAPATIIEPAGDAGVSVEQPAPTVPTVDPAAADDAAPDEAAPPA